MLSKQCVHKTSDCFMEWYNIAFVVVLIIVGIVVYRNKKNEY